MWGGSAAQPDTLNDKFGPDKTDNTPHLFNVAGKMVESFFSPSDNTNEQIIRSVNTADHEAYFATMVFTRTDLANAFADRVMNFGIYGAGIMNDSAGGSGPSFLIIQNAVGVARELLFDHATQPGILHHKYLIVDPNFAAADPLVLTGSHNWSSSATQKNDENTLIIHDALIANQYYQEFHNLFNTNGGALGIAAATQDADEFQFYPNPSNGSFRLSFNSNESAAAEIVISDLLGKTISSQKDRKSTRLNSSHIPLSRMPSSA